MNIIQAIFNACASIMRTTIDLFGYDISLMQVLAYGFAMYVVYHILKEAF